MKHDPPGRADDLTARADDQAVRPDVPGDVLEHNLRKLFAKSYAPVVPAPEFTARLAAELSTRLADRAWSRGTPSSSTADVASRPSGWLRALPRRALVAAAAVVVLGLSTWLTVFAPSRGPLSLDEVLARGCAALRLAGEPGWRAVEEREAQRGIDAGHGALEVVTPSSVPQKSTKGVLVRLLFGALGVSDGDESGQRAASSGQAVLGAASYVAIGHVVIEHDARSHVPEGESPVEHVRTLQLSGGTLSVERYDSGPAWSLEGCGARVELERGAVDLAIVDAVPYGGTGQCFLVHVVRGVSRAWIDGALSTLAPGTTIALQDGRALEASFGVDDPRTGSGRAPVATADATPDGNEPAAQNAATPEAGEAAPRTARLEGHIVAPEGLARPRRYTVTLLRHERLPEVSEPQAHPFDGPDRFVIDGLEPGDYEVLVETQDLGVWSVSITLAAGETKRIEVELARGIALRGRVVDDASGTPIEGAVVISEMDVPAQVIPFDLEPPVPWTASAVTLSDGTFELRGLGAGVRILRATKKGHGTAWSAPIDSASADSVVLRMARGGSVAGHVARGDGKPWGGAIIVASRMNPEIVGIGTQMQRIGYGIVEADALGDYRIDGLPAGEYVVLNVADVMTASSVRQATVKSGAVTTVDIPERVAGARFTGRVLDSEGRPIQSLDVTLQPTGNRSPSGWRSNRSDESGRFLFEGLREGGYDVFIGTGMDRRFVRQDTVEVRSSGEVERDIRLDAGAIRGRVTSAVDGSPCPETFLLVEKMGTDGFEFAGIDFTANDGSFAIDRLRAGTWRIMAFPSKRGLAPQQSREIVIAPDTLEARCDFEAARGASLRITVRDAAGEPVVGSTVTFGDERGEVVQLTVNDVTGAGGVLDVPGLAAGRWKIGARHGTRSAPETVLDLLPGDDREIALQLSP